MTRHLMALSRPIAYRLRGKHAFLQMLFAPLPFPLFPQIHQIQNHHYFGTTPHHFVLPLAPAPKENILNPSKLGLLSYQ